MSTPVGIHVVFTDLVGSTALGSRVGPAGAEELRQVHFRLLREALAAHGGTEVKNLGDGLMVVFPSLGSALDGSVAMQQAFERHNASGREPLGIRVGLSSGDATEEDGDYFGDPVVEAARLCAKCEAGQIITTELISRMSRRSGHAFEPIGDLDLKGIAEPVPAMVVAWEPAAMRSGVPLPDRLAVEHPSAMVGRAAEWGVAEAALKASQAGARRILLLAGEPGIGKTRLTTEVCRAAHDRGATVLYGRCDEDLAVPYQPWVDGIGHLVAHAPPDLLAAHVTAHGGELLAFAPELARRVDGVPDPTSSDPETERYLLFQAVAGLLAEAGSDAPVVMVLDDLHWADKATLQLLRHLAQAAPSPLLIIATYRSTELTNEHPLTDTLATLHRADGVDSVALRGLDDHGIVALLESVAGHQMDETGIGLAHAVLRETGGNPFFAGEILRHLSETGGIYQRDDGRWVAREDLDRSDLPESVRSVIGQRVNRLGPDVRDALSAASIIGRDFDLGLLASVTDRDPDELFDLLAPAVDGAVIAEVSGLDERYTFTHALMQHTLEESLPARRQRRLHQRVAEALEEACGEDPGDRVGELASHWLAATAPVDTTKALRYTRLAGDRALAKLAPDEAARWFTAALDVVDHLPVADDHERGALLLGLGEAQRQIGDVGFSATLLEAGAIARRVGDSDLLARAALATDRGFFAAVGLVNRDLVDLLEAALAAIGGADSDQRARLLALLAQELHYDADRDRRSELVDQSLEMARRLGDHVTIAYCLSRGGVAVLSVDDVERRQAYAIEAWELVESSDDPVARFWAVGHRLMSSLDMGDRDEFDALAVEFRRIAEGIGQPSLLWRAMWDEVSTALFDADHDRAETLAAEALALGDGAGFGTDAFIVYSAQLCVLRWQQGRYGELVELIEQNVADNPGMPMFRGILAQAQADAENGELAAELVRREFSSTRFELPHDHLYSVGLSCWADAAVLVGDVEACARLYDLLAPYPGLLAFNGAMISGGTDHSLGALARVLGHHEQAEVHLQAAQAFHERLRAPFHQARTHLERAQNFSQRGRPDDAATSRQHAETALAMARTHGCTALERRASEFLESFD